MAATSRAAARSTFAAIPFMFLSYPCCNRLQVNPRPPLVAAAGTAVAAAAAAPATAGAANHHCRHHSLPPQPSPLPSLPPQPSPPPLLPPLPSPPQSLTPPSPTLASATITSAAMFLRYHVRHWTAVAAAAAIATPTTTAAAIAIDSIASAADSTAAAAITAAIPAASAVSALVAHAAIAMLSAATLTTTSRSAGSAAAAAAAATISPRRCTLYAAPTPTHLRAPLPTRSRLPTALPALTPHFHAYRPDSNYVALVQERASGVVCNVQVRDLQSCSSDAPRLGLRACHLAIEWPLAATPKPLRCLHRNRR